MKMFYNIVVEVDLIIFQNKFIIYYLKEVFKELLESRCDVDGKESNINRRYRISSGFVLRQIAGEYVIVPIDATSEISNAVMTPNDTAGFLWKEFQEPSTIEDVIKRVEAEYEGNPEQISGDVKEFVIESVNLGILVEVE
ncbi:Coenzyme PQQ synthesis protein D (PqqD) [Eubacterium oxidoreducens]|uniref:Coenzyme PQQ synthesis protein D (PqqD) n=2 Tax=Eubacterium oxidoreducens TaxID=1732 RepID=A0A1G6B9P3_EUBOX|nr:Coenzyme PQQ synthesis protein D (PqqD) [Eubacterium oxidoreducens]